MNKIDLKIVLLGSENVGKTSLLQRFVNDRFNENQAYQETIGVAFSAKSRCTDNVNFTLGIWDTAGSERYEAMSKIYYRGAKAAIICYDITNSHSWNRAKFWVRELRSVEEECIVYICATKKDILDESVQPSPAIDMVERYASGIGAKFFITSSRTGENIQQLFDQISRDFVSNPQNLRALEQTEPINLTINTEKSHCCSTG